MRFILEVCGYFVLLYSVSPKDGHPQIIEWRVNRTEVPRMYRGITASVSKYPFYVMIFRNYKESGGWTYLCGGSLITLNVTLTACHCSDDGPLKYDTFVIGGVNDPWSGGAGRQSSFIQHVVHHPLCGKTKLREYPRSYDVGAMIHANSFVYSAYVKPLRLLSRNEDLNLFVFRIWALSNVSCLAVGNGLTGSGKNATLSRLTKVGRMLVITNEECMKRMCSEGYTALCDYDFEEHGHFCLHASEAMPCGSDSGGPVIINGFVMGVVSWTTECKLGYMFGAANIKGITEVANLFLYPPTTMLEPNPGNNSNRKVTTACKSSSFTIPTAYLFILLAVTFRTIK